METSLLGHAMSDELHTELSALAAAATEVFGAAGDEPLVLQRSSDDGLLHHRDPFDTRGGARVCGASGAQLDAAEVTATLAEHLRGGSLCCCVEDATGEFTDRGTFLRTATHVAAVAGHFDALAAVPGPHRWVRWARAAETLQMLERFVESRVELGHGTHPVAARVAGLVESSRDVERHVVSRWRAAADQPEALVWWAARHQYNELVRRGYEGRTAGRLAYLEHLIEGGTSGDWAPVAERRSWAHGDDGWSGMAAWQQTAAWDAELLRLAADAAQHQVTALVRDVAVDSPTNVLCAQFGVARQQGRRLWVVRAPSMAVSLCTQTYLLGGYVPTEDSARFLLEMLDGDVFPSPRTAEALALTRAAFD